MNSIIFWGAHAPRVLAAAPPPSRTLISNFKLGRQDGFGEAPKPAREARALPRTEAFTIIELLIVMAIIIILAGLVLGISGYAHEKGARSRAEAEIAAMSAALESYKADNGVYVSTDVTNGLAATEKDPTAYRSASLDLYKFLSGDRNADGTAEPGQKSYFAFKAQMLGGPRDSAGNVTIQYLRDPFGNSYGYSTAKASTPASASGYNPTYDLWSTGGSTTDTAKWIKNW